GGASLVGRARGGSGHEESPRVGGHRRGSGPLGRSAASISAMAGALDRGPNPIIAHSAAGDEECVRAHTRPGPANAALGTPSSPRTLGSARPPLPRTLRYATPSTANATFCGRNRNFAA